MDIYMCNTIYPDSLRRRNILYVNQGIDKDGIPHFKDMAAEYGLDIHVQSTMASFFDYDNDGDLDMYLTVNEASTGDNPSAFLVRNQKKTSSMGRLYRNDWEASWDIRYIMMFQKQPGLYSKVSAMPLLFAISIMTDGRIFIFQTILYQTIFSTSITTTEHLRTG